MLADVDGGLTGGCAQRHSIKDSPSYVAWREDQSSSVDVAVLVPDAYTAAKVDGQTVPVANIVVLTHAPAGEHGSVELSGDQATIDGNLDLADDN